MYFCLLSDIVPLIVIRKSNDGRSNVRWKVFWKWLLIWAYILQLVLSLSLQSSTDAKTKKNELIVVQRSSDHQGDESKSWSIFISWRWTLDSWALLDMFFGGRNVKRFLGSLQRSSCSRVAVAATTWMVENLHRWNIHFGWYVKQRPVATQQLSFPDILPTQKRRQNCSSNVGRSLLRGHSGHICLWKIVLKLPSGLWFFCSGSPETKCQFMRFNDTTWRMNLRHGSVLFRSNDPIVVRFNRSDAKLLN